jgi:DNA repair exonuclease SbcCD ATPase subunit
MSKSKHPALLEKATDDLARMNKEVKKSVAALEEITKACANAGKIAASTAKVYSDQYEYLTKIIEKYAKKVAEIDSIEGQLDGDAKGDKKAEAKLKKQLADAEKEADGLRAEYREAGEVFGTLSVVVKEEADKVTAAREKFEGFKAPS